MIIESIAAAIIAAAKGYTLNVVIASIAASLTTGGVVSGVATYYISNKHLKEKLKEIERKEAAHDPAIKAKKSRLEDITALETVQQKCAIEISKENKVHFSSALKKALDCIDLKDAEIHDLAQALQDIQTLSKKQSLVIDKLKKQNLALYEMLTTSELTQDKTEPTAYSPTMFS